MTDLKEVAPEPVELSASMGPSTSTPSENRHGSVLRAIGILNKVQTYSVLPFSAFSCLHILGVVITPAIFGTEAGDDMIGLGREIYHVPLVEYGILGSAAVHVISGVSLNLARKYYRYLKYGKSNIKKRQSGDDKLIVPGKEEDIEVRDADKGLGGITSVLGAGSRVSFTSRYLGLSPLAFSGYFFLALLTGHVYYERVSPIVVDGDSSFVDLSYVAYSLQKTFLKTYFGLNTLVLVGSYHMLVGMNRILRRFTLKQRKMTYKAIFVLATLGAVSLWRISQIDVLPAMAAKFHSYVP
ncbi:uncharacterized protein C5L36_0A04530 [Pichia kudriavzevii]|uniref:Mitochondrial adapter protein MCP1 transmembrane domain-containing protein n=2 Tax=Pichia kudriavzevii TaxID=4909 RepID=A0A2U9QXY4_PICKU|nr:uncharacterized protein C5L36_0A04530 [Pichia kudriavzevii]AWU73856.1 hypothetical protein C5L36_0A04530 [Pichia kudriavzevii]